MSTIIEIYNRIWLLSKRIQCVESYLELTRLTNELIEIYDSQGRLDQDPFTPTRERKLSLPFYEINAELKDSTCVVTGGHGCVGTILVQQLLKFDVETIIILDNNEINTQIDDERVISIKCDVRNIEHVSEVFQRYLPEIVFHCAARRDPGLAETTVSETVTTNVMGTLNIVNVCEQTETVKQIVFSSTGKASRYFTEEIYAGTKKVCEYIFDTYAKSSRIKYSMVRFTHILDNSLMNIELKKESEYDNYVAVHSPGKYVTAQNAKEAAQLMLNAIIFSEEGQCNYLLVRYLEWPVESLQMALYYIKKSGRSIPVIFIGNPTGYTENFFRGQMDWSRPNELNLLSNVYETKDRRLNPDNDIIISHACSTNKAVLDRVLAGIKNVNGERETKKALIEGLKEIVIESLKMVDKDDTINILRWGLDPKFLMINKAKISDFGEIVPLLVDSLAGCENYEQIEDLVYQKAG